MTSDVFRILLLSDIHATTAGLDDYGVDGAGLLAQLLLEIRQEDPVDLVVVCGDVTDDGERSSCASVREIVDVFADSLGIARVFLPGNHDSRATFRRVLGAGHFGSGGSEVATRVHESDECAAVSLHNGLRVVTLDSVVPGAMFGALSNAQLAWLTEVLEDNAPRGTVLALHHPPLTLQGSPFLNKVGLRNSNELAKVLKGTDVHGILCGHFHAPIAGSLGAKPVWVTPGVANQVDLTAPPDVLRFVSGAGASIIALASEGPATFQVIRSESGRRDRVIQEIQVTPELLSQHEIADVDAG